MNIDPMQTPPNLPHVSIVFLHGFGERSERYVEHANRFKFPTGFGARFVIPQAPLRESTLKLGKQMHAWLDWIDVKNRVPMRDTVDESSRSIEALIEAEKNSGYPSERIFLVGFSQGGSMALHTALRYPEPLGGVAVLSSYCPTLDSLDSERSAANQHIPMYLAQGMSDKVITPEMGMKARDRLIELGYRPRWTEYDMGHEIGDQELADLSSWIFDSLR